jgi:hypothetical protein
MTPYNTPTHSHHYTVHDRLLGTVGISNWLYYCCQLTILTIILLLQNPHPWAAQAMLAYPDPFYEKQPNGETVQLQVHGDTYDAWMTDLDGYTVLRDLSTGSFMYAEEDGQGGLRPSHLLVTRPHHQHNNEDNSSIDLPGNRNHPRNLLQQLQEQQEPSHHKKKFRRHLRPSQRDCHQVICNNDEASHSQRRADQRLRGSQIYQTIPNNTTRGVARGCNLQHS